MVPGELTLHDLPPIEDLKITLDEKVTLSAIGNVESVVDCLGKYDEISLFMYVCMCFMYVCVYLTNYH